MRPTCTNLFLFVPDVHLGEARYRAVHSTCLRFRASIYNGTQKKKTKRQNRESAATELWKSFRGTSASAWRGRRQRAWERTGRGEQRWRRKVRGRKKERLESSVAATSRSLVDPTSARRRAAQSSLVKCRAPCTTGRRSSGSVVASGHEDDRFDCTHIAV